MLCYSNVNGSLVCHISKLLQSMFKYLSILRKKATWKCGNLFIIRLAYTGYSCIGWLSLLPYKMILLEPENAITAFSGRTKLKKNYWHTKANLALKFGQAIQLSSGINEWIEGMQYFWQEYLRRQMTKIVLCVSSEANTRLQLSNRWWMSTHSTKVLALSWKRAHPDQMIPTIQHNLCVSSESGSLYFGGHTLSTTAT